MLIITHGSIFDKKCDLLIIPCNTAGGVTRWVFHNLKDNGIPLPELYIPLGKVFFINTRLHTENAEIVGFAASVALEENRSSAEAIESIGKNILEYCKDNNLRQVNVPLLGAGAGRLSAFASFESMKKSFSSVEAKKIDFEIFIPSTKICKTFNASYPNFFIEHKKIKNPRVFISYASDDKENAKWVKKLAVKLRENGVDARLDKFHLKAGTDLPQWMTNEVIMADKVLLICDHNYMIKADIHSGGVGWETMIVQGDMLLQGESMNKYIAIVRETEIDKGLPIYMKSKAALHWGMDGHFSDDEFLELLHTIFDCDTAPDLGPVPPFIIEKLPSGN